MKVSGPAKLALSTTFSKGGEDQRSWSGKNRLAILESQAAGLTFPKALPLVAHLNERNPPSKGRRSISKPSLLSQPTSRPLSSSPLSPSHSNLSPPLPTANRPNPHLSSVSSVPAPSRQRPTFVGLVPCLAARKRKAHRGHSGVGGRSGCWRSPTSISDKAR